MRILKAAALVAMLAVVPAAAFGEAAAQKKVAPAAKKSTAMASHTTTGTVKSSSDTTLVISKAGKDQTFTVNSSTQKQGAIETGARVSVHYTMDGKDMVATAISVQPGKTSKGKK